MYTKLEYYCRTSPVDECTFCIQAEGYTESKLNPQGMSGSNIQAWTQQVIIEVLNITCEIGDIKIL